MWLGGKLGYKRKRGINKQWHLLPLLLGKKSILNKKPQKGMCIQISQNIPFLGVAFWNQVLLVLLMK